MCGKNPPKYNPGPGPKPQTPEASARQNYDKDFAASFASGTNNNKGFANSFTTKNNIAGANQPREPKDPIRNGLSGSPQEQASLRKSTLGS